MIKKRKVVQPKVSYVNVNRTKSEYKDKYKKGVEKALKEFCGKIGKKDKSEFTNTEWKSFFKTVLIPLDKDSEKMMISLFKDNRDELNELLILHNTLASNNLAEVYFKKYEKEFPTHWHDLDDFKQMALEGLSIAAQRFDLSYKNKFITYATWWVLNRVRKPYSEKGAFKKHTSLSTPINESTGDESATIEDVISSEMVAPDCQMSNVDSDKSSPTYSIDQRQVDDNYDLCTLLKKTKTLNNIDEKHASDIANYLISIVDRNEGSYQDKQIFLYLFKRILNKCSSFVNSPKLKSYVSEAAKSKIELLKRLNMNEKQYDMTCRTITRKGLYDGI